jgi:uracil-DNA glycosylase
MNAKAIEVVAAAGRLRALRAAMIGCVRCEALVKCRSQVVPGHGAAPAMVAFVGLAPGRLGGDRTGIPFSGDRSGDLLRVMIARAYLKRVFITNVVRCNPRDARGRNRDPSAREIANCRDHLAAELAVARPRLVACLGAVAWREMAGREAPFRPRRPAALSIGGVLLYPMYHPAYVVRGAYPERAYARDFVRLRRLLRRLAESHGRTNTSLAEQYPAPVQPHTDLGMI